MTDGCSIVVVTSGLRKAWLHRCIDALSAQVRPEDELICVSLVPDERLEEHEGVRFVHEPRVGVSLAKNVGWRTASRRVVAFTDDDCLPAADWISAIEVAFQEAEADAVTGRVVPVSASGWTASAPVSSAPRIFRRLTDVHWPWDPGAGNNMAFRQEVLEAVGGFDERIGPGTVFPSGEDLDVFLRLLASRKSIAYHPEVQIAHEPMHDPALIQRSLLAYRFGMGALFAKFRGVLESGVPEFLVERDGRALVRSAVQGDPDGVRVWVRACVSLLRGFHAWMISFPEG